MARRVVFLDIDRSDDYLWPRGYEIQQWLDAQGDVEGIVILDDWQVRTTVADGLLDEHVQRALEIIRRPAPPRSGE